MVLTTSRRLSRRAHLLLALLLVLGGGGGGSNSNSNSNNNVWFANAQEGEIGQYYEIVAYASNDCVTNPLLSDADVYLDLFETINPDYTASPPPPPTEVVEVIEDVVVEVNTGSTSTTISAIEERPLSCKKPPRTTKSTKKSTKRSPKDGPQRQLVQQQQRRERRGTCPKTCSSPNPDYSLCLMVGCAVRKDSNRRRFLFVRGGGTKVIEANVEETIRVLNEEKDKRNYCEDLSPEECQVEMGVVEDVE